MIYWFDKFMNWLIVWLKDCWIRRQIIDYLWIGEFLGGLMDGELNGWIDEWIGGLMDWWIDVLDEWWIDGLMDWMIDG